MAFGWACGALDLLTWVCGEASEGPLSGQHVTGRPALYQLSLEASRGMSGVESARRQGNPLRAGRLESAMETFLWLTGWNSTPPVDRHGHGTFDACPERNVPCLCNGAGRCLRDACAACRRAPCVPPPSPRRPGKTRSGPAAYRNHLDPIGQPERLRSRQVAVTALASRSIIIIGGGQLIWPGGRNAQAACCPSGPAEGGAGMRPPRECQPTTGPSGMGASSVTFCPARETTRPRRGRTTCSP